MNPLNQTQQTIKTIDSELKLNEEVEKDSINSKEEVKARSPARIDFEREVPVKEEEQETEKEDIVKVKVKKKISTLKPLNDNTEL